MNPGGGGAGGGPGRKLLAPGHACPFPSSPTHCPRPESRGLPDSAFQSHEQSVPQERLTVCSPSGAWVRVRGGSPYVACPGPVCQVPPVGSVVLPANVFGVVPQRPHLRECSPSPKRSPQQQMGTGVLLCIPTPRPRPWSKLQGRWRATDRDQDVQC